MVKVFFFLLAILLAPIYRVAAQTPYYQGKTITIITGSQTGDLYDIYARMIATHMAKHIAGAPNILVQNMVGAERVHKQRIAAKWTVRAGEVFQGRC